MATLRPAGNDPIMRQILEHGWKRVIICIVLSYAIVIIPFLLAWKNGTLISGTVNMPALEDWGYFNQYFFLLPVFIWVTHFYFYPLETMLISLKKDNIVQFKDKHDYFKFVQKANKIYSHPFITFGPYVAMACITVFEVYHYWFSDISTWYSPFKGIRFVTVSYVTVIPVMMLYYIIPAFIFRVGTTYFVFRNFFQEKVHIHPMHPDKCGGMSSLGTFSVRVTIPAIIVGIGILVGLYANFYQYFIPLFGVPNVVMMASYIFGMGVLFFLPLLAVRNEMMTAKKQTLRIISDKFNEIFRGRIPINTDKLSNMDILKGQMETYEYLNKQYAITNSMPVYPFNLENIIKFVYSVLWPVVLLIIQWSLGLL